MRRRLAGGLAAALAAATIAVVTQVASGGTPASAASADPYTWKNVQIGGGGFVPGIIFNQSQANLVYARTDIGGAYRWDPANNRWIPLLDWVGFNNWGYNGVVSLASDAVDPNRVYVAAGMYTNSWDPNNGAILRSTDKGNTWSVTQLPFKLGGNMPGRGMGERLAIDPNKNSILYLGAPSGNGLWKSTDYGATWAKVTNFPNPGNYVQTPGDAYGGDNQGIVWVSFDKSTGTSANTTQGIYVGVADKNNTVYRSTDGGATWSAIAGAPTGYIAHKGVVDPVNHLLYIATSDTGGPYDGARGDVWKYAISTGTWTQISPVPSSDSSNDYFGYSGLTIDRQHPNVIMVATQVSWWPDMIMWRSTDSGATWTRIWDWTSYPSRSLRYTLSISSEPWLTFGVQPADPVPSPKLGWMNESVEIDPFNSNHLLYGTGATIYGTNNLTNWDSGGTISIAPVVNGLEETAVNDLISPPTGAPLLSALGDVTGFKHTNLDAVPSMMFTTPNFSTSTSIDFAETNPSDIVRVGNVDTSANPGVTHIGFSTDGGSNWWQGTEPGGVTGGGVVAAAADASRFVWSPQGAGVYYSVGFGTSWTASAGIPTGATVAADRVNPKKFYGFSGGTFYTSTDGGATFTASAASGLPASGTVHVKAVAGHEGDVWLAGGSTSGAYGLWHSTDSGATFTKLSTVDQADNIGFGKAAPGQTYPALYAIAQVGGVRGVFRSDDSGSTWVRVNDDAHQYGNIGQAITGDPRVWGRVYLGTNGRGILYGDRVGGTASPTASTSRSASPSPSTSSASPSVSPTRSTSPSASPTPTATGGACSVAYTIVGQWQGGFQGDVKVTNTSATAVNGWTLRWTFANGQVINQLWNGTPSQSGAAVTVTNAAYNATLAAGGGSADVGFTGSWNNSTNAKPTSFTLNGTACTVS